MNGQTRPRKTIHFLALLLVAPFPVFGAFFSKKDRGHHGPPILEQGIGVRAAGVADAYVGIADDVSALYWNPAGMEHVPTQEVLFMRGDSYGGKTHDFFGYLLPFWSKSERRTVGVSFSRLSVDPFDLVEEGQTVGRAKPSESSLGFSYAQPWGGLAAGASVKTVRQKLDDQSAQAWAADFGVLGEALNGRFTWGASAANLGTSLHGDGLDVPLPLTVRVGGAYRFFDPRAGRSGFVVAAQIDAPDDDLAVGRWGVEYSKSLSSSWLVAARAGWASHGSGSEPGQWSLGGGVEAGPLRINFAQLLSGTMGSETRADVAVRFGQEPALEVQRRRWITEGKEALSQGNLLDAQNAVDHALKISPGHSPALRLAGHIRNRYAESIDPLTLFSQGRKALDEKKFDVSVGYFRKLKVVAPDYPGAKEGLEKAEILAEQEKLIQVKESVQKARGNKIQNLTRQAGVAMRRNEWEKALAHWRNVLSLDAGNKEAAQGASACRDSIRLQAERVSQAGDVSGAISIYRLLQADDARDKETARRMMDLEQELSRRNAAAGKKSYDRGIDAYTAGDFLRAQRLFRRALELNPQDVRVRQALERTESELKQMKKP